MIEDELITMKVFYSYASEDQALRDQLEKHLGNLMRQGIITSWSNRDINAGEEWEKTIHTYLDEADIVLLLISSDFISSDFCYSVELQKALEKQRAGQAEVLPILLRPVHWEASPFSHLAVLPTNMKPINIWPSVDEAFVEVVKGIKQVVQDKVVQKLLQRGEKLLLEGRPEEALTSYEKAIQVNSTTHSAFALKGDILLNYLNRPEEALTAYQQASEIEPTNALYFIKMGDLLFFRKRLVAYRRACELEPMNASYFRRIGDTIAPSGQKELHQEGLAAYRRACELESTNTSHFVKMSEFLYWEFAQEEAIAAFKDAYKLVCEFEPTNVSHFIEIGKFLVRLRRYEDALLAYQRASELEPTNISHADTIANILVELDRNEEARDAYQRCFALSPEWQYLNNIGGCLEKLHRYEDALIIYQKMSELYPTVDYAQANMGNIYLNHFYDHQKALIAYQQASKLCTWKPEYYVKIGDIFLDDRAYEKAITAYRQAIDNSKEPAYYEKLAEVLEIWARELRGIAINRRR